MLPGAGQGRAIIENVQPEIDCGNFAIKRVLGDRVVVEADIFADGHDALGSVLLYKRYSDTHWNEAPMYPVGNIVDRWRGEFVATELGQHVYSVRAWVDHFKTWRRDLQKRIDAGQDVAVDLLIGADMIEATGKRARGADGKWLKTIAQSLRDEGSQREKIQQALDEELFAMMRRYPDKRTATSYDKKLPLTVEPQRAQFSTWYEMFPRSCSPEAGRHGTFADCEARLPYVADMGFDVVYLPPIHPIGQAFRKGKNNSVTARPDDVGSPWAIGAQEGGHKAVHPDLGTLKDFRRFVQKANDLGIQVALDIAFQCSPDHPYVQEHPEWFQQRPDGTIQYAENPPKKYQDIYPFHFETDNWKALWEELKSIFLFWIEQGVTIFRVDNPHTKSFNFWEWCIQEIKQQHPETIFLSEAFARPTLMYGLAKLGFSQSYTYFTWRNEKWNLTEYLTELTQTRVREFFRPNFWPNTPDILNEYLQQGGPPAFKIRLLLAGTLSANYGIYGPAYELCVRSPAKPGSEEYLNSEKYECWYWNLDAPQSLRGLIRTVNQIRHANPALQQNESLRFHHTDNDNFICYSKKTADGANRILVIVSLNPHHLQIGWVGINLDALGIDPHQPYQVHDLLTGVSYTWQGSWNYVELDPHTIPAHIFRI